MCLHGRGGESGDTERVDGAGWKAEEAASWLFGQVRTLLPPEGSEERYSAACYVADLASRNHAVTLAVTRAAGKPLLRRSERQ